MAAGEKKQAFNTALDHFCEVMNSGSKSAHDFFEGFSAKQAQFEISITGKDGEYYAESIQPWYFADAVNMYRRRTDQHKDETGLLFDPKAKHIRMLRSMIDDMKKGYDKGTAEHIAAGKVEAALNGVQENMYLPRGLKAPEIPLEIVGYHGGVVVRKYGTYDKHPIADDMVTFEGNKVYEVGTEWLPLDLIARNAITQLPNYKITASDIAAVKLDGDVVRFNRLNNYVEPDRVRKGTKEVSADPVIDGHFDRVFTQERYRVSSRWPDKGYKPLPEETTRNFERNILMPMVEQAPGLVDEYIATPKRQKGGK